MAQAEKAPEPSMDEILASIRKIIADEPASGAAGGKGTGAASPRSGWPSPSAKAEPTTSAASSIGGAADGDDKKADIDDILDMADSEPQKPSPTAGDQTSGPTIGRDVPSWLFPGARKSDSAASAGQQGGAAKADSADGAIAKSDDIKQPVAQADGPGTSRAAGTPEPAMTPTPTAKEAAPRPFFAGAHAALGRRPDGAEASGNGASGRSTQTGDLGAVVPRRPMDDDGGRAGERRAIEPRLPERVRQAAAAVGIASPAPVPAPAEPTRIANSRDDMSGKAEAGEVPAASIGKDVGSAPSTAPAARSKPEAKSMEAGLSSSGSGGADHKAQTADKGTAAALPSDADLPLAFADLPKMPSLPGEEKPAVAAPKPEATVDAKTEATGKAETVAKAEPVASAATIVKDAAAGQTGLSDKAATPPAPLASPGQGVAAAFGGSGGMGSTRISVPDAKPDAAPSPAAETTLPVDVPTHEVGVAAAVAKPTVLGDRGRTVRSGVPGDAVPTVAQAGAVRTLEDTVVDLLRPMIRQWLDDNMPRMVEKALRIELASSVKNKLDQPKH